jgi:hypothetical protein
MNDVTTTAHGNTPKCSVENSESSFFDDVKFMFPRVVLPRADVTANKELSYVSRSRVFSRTVVTMEWEISWEGRHK